MMSRFDRLPRREPLRRTWLRGIGAGVFLVGAPLVLWLYVLGVVHDGGVEWHRAPRAIVLTVLGVGFFGILLRDLLRVQGLLPLMRWRFVGDGWELRFANELLGWRTVATVKSGTTIEVTQSGNNPSWVRFTSTKADAPYPRCAIHVSAPGVETEVHATVPLHRRYVEQVQELMKKDGLDVTIKFRSSVRPVSPYDSMPAG